MRLQCSEVEFAANLPSLLKFPILSNKMFRSVTMFPSFSCSVF